MPTSTSRFGNLRDDDGALVTEAAILYPMIFVVVLFAVQFGMFLYADMIVEQAAQQGIREVVLNGPAGASVTQNRAQQGADAVLSNVTGGIHNVRVTSIRNWRSAAVRVTAEPPYVFPWFRSTFDFDVDARAYAEFEQYRNQNERG